MDVRSWVKRQGKTVWDVSLDTLHSWSKHKVTIRAAAMSYYFLVTLAPLVLVVLYVLSHIVGSSEPGGLLSSADVSQSGADALSQVITVAENYSAQMNWSGPLISAGIAVVGATVLLGNFSAALDSIWESVPENGGWRYFLRRRVLGALGLFVILLVALGIGIFVAVATQLLNVIERLVEQAITLPGSLQSLLELGWLIGIVFFTILFSLAFTFLPSRKIRWFDTLLGSAITAAAYLIGQRALGIYLDRSSVVSAWGAIGSFVGLVIWIYYTMQVVMAGAELTRQIVLRAETARGGVVTQEPASS